MCTSSWSTPRAPGPAAAYMTDESAWVMRAVAGWLALPLDARAVTAATSTSIAPCPTWALCPALPCPALPPLLILTVSRSRASVFFFFVAHSEFPDTSIKLDDKKDASGGCAC